MGYVPRETYHEQPQYRMQQNQLTDDAGALEDRYDYMARDYDEGNISNSDASAFTDGV